MSDTKPKSTPAASAPAAGSNTTDQPAIQQKIAPYPIDASILRASNPAPVKGSIVKLTEFGFLMRVAADHFYSVGETQQVELTLPATTHKIQNNTLVMKTYDAMAYSVTDKLKMVELHFVNLPLEHVKAIRKYLVASGQAKTE